ncbi:MAG: hypothetical protein HGA22_01405 [Clostridiales bacterium]|nr:hypothetical protein [Clostridiales bacterium]
MKGKEEKELILNGKLYLNGKIVTEMEVSEEYPGQPFHDRLENCMVALCSLLEIPVPLWLRKNTRELGLFSRTFFPSEQFIEKVWFDKFEMRLVSR